MVQEGCADFSACDILIALHAIKSGGAIARYRKAFPDLPVLVVLTGTDFFNPGGNRPVLEQSLGHADRVIVLQSHLASRLPLETRAKVRVIYQSFAPPTTKDLPAEDCLEVCVLGHLRAVKDSLLAARAARLLPVDSRIRITQVGGALEPEQAQLARQEQVENPRYQWLGELPRTEAVRVLGRCRLLVQSSLAEGGPSAVSEAVALEIPVLSTPTSGVVGLLGESYAGYFPFSDPASLAALMRRVETEPGFAGTLLAQSATARELIQPRREMEAWKSLLAEFHPTPGK